jgi:hypothetical protein
VNEISDICSTNVLQNQSFNCLTYRNSNKVIQKTEVEMLNQICLYAVAQIQKQTIFFPQMTKNKVLDLELDFSLLSEQSFKMELNFCCLDLFAQCYVGSKFLSQVITNKRIVNSYIDVLFKDHFFFIKQVCQATQNLVQQQMVVSNLQHRLRSMDIMKKTVVDHVCSDISQNIICAYL